MTITLLHGDCRAVLPTLPSASVQCVVTSPPYYGLRSYLPTDHPDKAAEIGSERTPAEYIAALVEVFREVFREVRRVLRPDGTLWLNLGDSYAGAKSGNTNGGTSSGLKNDGRPEASRLRSIAIQSRNGASMEFRKELAPDLKSKDLMMMPARVALALQADGWWLRSDIVWAKPNPMPESVTDRPTSAHEHVFLLAKSAAYFYDAEAVREETESIRVRETTTWADRKASGEPVRRGDPGISGHITRTATLASGAGRNTRNVWTIATAPFAEAHFATFPPALVERCVKAGSRPGDTILDPFSGAGTTAMVADRLGRHAIGIDLSPTYGAMSRERIVTDAGLFADFAPAAEAAE